jgi:hypothetical protein
MSKLYINIEGVDDLNTKVDKLTSLIQNLNKSAEHTILDNKGLLDYLKISLTTAQKLRNEGKIAYSKDGRTGKIWYRLSDVLSYLDSCYNKRFKR